MTDKGNVICILKILEEYSDEDHILSMQQIQEKMDSLYGLKPDRRTVYSAVEVLGQMGYDISSFRENGKGYFLRERSFETGEILMLTDAVGAFQYISQKQTEELTAKLKSLLSMHQRKQIHTADIIRTENKSPNPQVVLNIEILSQAINERKKVSFIYMDYDYDKKLHARREERYVANPYGMICDSEHYYLVMISRGHTDPSFYRIDMMSDIIILDEKIDISKTDARLNTIKRVVYAHAGKPENIRLRCKKKVLRYVLEKFGTDIVIIPDPEDPYTFETSFKAPAEGMVYWALQYLPEVEVLAPESLRERIKQAIKANSYFDD